MTMSQKDIYALQWINELTGEIKNHGLFDSVESAVRSIYSWWHLMRFKPHYVRYWESSNDRWKVDYGIHTVFYTITKVDKHSFPEVMFPLPKSEEKNEL